MDANIELEPSISECARSALRSLLRTWFAFERRLARVPIIARLDAGTFGLPDYRNLLLNLRPQVVEGSRWISRAASSFDRDHADVRSLIIGHAWDEHRDYEMLEQDYVGIGGDLPTIQVRARNAGSEALHGYLMYRASQPNPVCLLGAMWIVEGLGQKMAHDWAVRIAELTGVGDEHLRFLRYHGANDDGHMEKFYRLLDRLCVSDDVGSNILVVADVVSRLYALQLELIDAA